MLILIRFHVYSRTCRQRRFASYEVTKIILMTYLLQCLHVIEFAFRQRLVKVFLNKLSNFYDQESFTYIAHGFRQWRIFFVLRFWALHPRLIYLSSQETLKSHYYFWFNTISFFATMKSLQYQENFSNAFCSKRSLRQFVFSDRENRAAAVPVPCETYIPLQSHRWPYWRSSPHLAAIDHSIQDRPARFSLRSFAPGYLESSERPAVSSKKHEN